MALAHSPRVVTNGLALCLDAANLKSYPGTGTDWYDLSGNNFNGYINSTPIFNDEKKGNFIFNGTSDIITFGDVLGIESNFSINIWIKGNTVQSGSYGGIVSKGSGSNFGNYGFYGDVSNTYVRFGFVDTSDIQREISNSTYLDLVLNNWVNYCGIYDLSKLYLYRNGVLIQQGSYTTTPKLFPANFLSIGGRSAPTFSNFLKMSMSSAFIYNRALSYQEIQQNFNALRGRFGI